MDNIEPPENGNTEKYKTIILHSVLFLSVFGFVVRMTGNYGIDMFTTCLGICSFYFSIYQILKMELTSFKEVFTKDITKIIDNKLGTVKGKLSKIENRVNKLEKSLWSSSLETSKKRISLC